MTTDIYVPSQWSDLIRCAKETLPKFNVIEMHAEHFLDCSVLLSNFCTNRKKTIDNSPVNWFTIRKIQYLKEQPLQLFFETYDDVMQKYDERNEFTPNVLKNLCVKKRVFDRNEFMITELPLLYANG